MRDVVWVGSAREDMQTFPAEVRRVMGFALFQAQNGLNHRSAKPLKGFGSAGVVEVVDDHDGNTYRTVYTVRMQTALYVLHAFQKKSTRGIATPRRELDLIKSRLAWAAQIEAERVARQQEIKR